MGRGQDGTQTNTDHEPGEELSSVMSRDLTDVTQTETDTHDRTKWAERLVLGSGAALTVPIC